MRRVYHGTMYEELDSIQAEYSTETKCECIFAAKSKEIAALFANSLFRNTSCEKGINLDGIPYIREKYKGELDRQYKGIKGFIYTLCGDSFLENRTHWEADLVSFNKEEEVLSVDIVDDLLEYLEEFERQGKLLIYRCD